MFEPNYQISPALLKTLKHIAILVYKLNKQKLNKVVQAELIKETQVNSTFASTTIEGNPLSLTAIKQLLKHKPEQLQKSELEVLNYNNLLLMLENKTFSEQLVLDIHRNVMTELMIKEKCGVYRQEPVVIHDPRTSKIVFLPPDYKDVGKLMKELFNFVNNADLDPVILAGIFHKQFAIIHPFLDGNGRTVRLATTVLLKELGCNLFSLLSFENYYNYDISRYFYYVGGQGNYYDLAVDFTPWLEYFASGILDELQRLEKRLEQNQASFRLKPHHKIILDYLAEHSTITDREYAKLVARAKATRALDFKFLIELGFIERKGNGPATYYVKG